MKHLSVPEVVGFEFLGDYVVELTFKNKKRIVVDLEPYLTGKMFEPLLDPDAFHQMFIDEAGGLAWPSGADMCPTMIYYDLPPASVAV